MKTRRNGEHQMAGMEQPSHTRRLIAWATMVAYLGQPLAVTAQVTADQSAASHHRPTVGTASNGVKLVQITAPSTAGVSRNQYSQFNVDPRGLILNNSPTVVQTQLGGYVAGNPNLNGTGARIILNEVTGTGQSQLRGYTEVAGQRAEVVIANPNGITCDGCGFINTSRGVLTTGTPVMGGSGSLDAFRVTGGQIQIGAGGLNGGNTDQLDLIARSVKVNGELWANNLNAVTGTNRVNYADLGVQLIQGDADKPTIGIDVALLGGMYANKIRLIGTETGVGVNSLGTLAAQAGDFTLDNRGRITLAGNTSAGGNVSINGNEGIANSGTLYGRRNVQITSSGDIGNSGTMAAQGNLSASGATVNSTGILGAGIDANGVASQNGTLNIAAANRIDASGQNIAGGDLSMTAAALNLANGQTRAGAATRLLASAGDIDLTNGILQSAGALTLDAAGNLNNDRGTIAGAQIDIGSAGLGNRGGRIVQTGSGNTVIRATGLLDNTGGTIESNGQNLSIQSENLVNIQGQINHAGNGLLSMTTGSLDNVGGTIGSNGRATVAAAGLDNRNGILSVAGSTDINVTGAISNIGGNIESGAALNIAGASLDNSAGRLVSLNGNGLTLDIAGLLANGAGTTAGGLQGGLIGGNGDVTINAGNLNNSGDVVAVNNMTANIGGVLDNSSGTIVAGQLGITAADLTNRQGVIAQTGTGATTLDVSGVLDNSSGTIQTNSTNFSLTPQTLINDGGTIAHGGAGTLSIDTGELSNTGGGIGTNGSANISAASIDNRSGYVSALQDAVIQSLGGLDNGNQGYIGANNLTISAQGSLGNQGGMIESANSLSIGSRSLDNANGIVQALGNGALTIDLAQDLFNTQNGFIGGNGSVDVGAAAMDNSGGQIYGKGNLTVAANGAFTNRGGIIQTDANLDVAANGALDNTGGRIEANGASGSIALSGASIDNTGGRIANSGTGQATINGGTGITNRNAANVAGMGFIGGNGNVTVAADGIDNSGGIAAQGDLALNVTGTLKNNGGTLASGGDLAIDAAAAIDNRQGTINAGRGARMASAQFDNRGGSLFAGGLDLGVGSLDNRTGNITQLGAGSTTLDVAGILDNSGGLIQSNGTDFGASAQTLTNDGGTILHAGSGLTTIDSGELSNTGGRIVTNGQAAITADNLVNQGGTLSAQKQASIVSRNAIDNGLWNGTGGYIGADSLVMTASNGQVNNASGTMEATNGIVLNALSLDNAGGTLQNLGAAALDLTVAQAVSNIASAGGTRGFIGSGGQISFAAASLDNASGDIYGKGGLAIQSGGILRNQNGLIQTDADLSVTAAGALNNTGGRIESKGTASTVTVSAAGITNTAGRIANAGTGLTRVTSTAAIANSNAAATAGMGMIGGNGDVTIAAASLGNTQGGQVFAGAGLSLDADSLNNSAGTLYGQTGLTMNKPAAAVNNTGGSIGAGGNIGLTVASLNNTNGKVGTTQGSGGNIGIAASGNVTNTGGQIYADQDLSLAANTLVGNGKAIGGRDATIDLQGNYTNQAGNQITANHDLSFSTTGNLTNAGTLQAVNDVTLGAANITNQGTLAAGGKLGANTAILTNTGSLVGGEVSIAATQKIVNAGPSAFIGASNAAGKLELLAPVIQNRDDTTATDTPAQTTIYGLGQVVLAGGKNAAGQYTKATQVLNQSGLIQSGGNMSIHANTLTNTRRVLQMSNTFTQVGGTVSKTGYWYNDPANIPGGQPANWNIGGAYNSGYMYTAWSETKYRNSVLNISPAAQIVSGGNLTPSVTTLQNYWSKVTAAGNIGLSGVTLDQNSWRGATPALQRTTYSGTWWYQHYTGVYWTPAGNFTQTVETPLPGYDSTFTARGTISGTGATIHNTAGSSAATPLGGISGQTVQTGGSASLTSQGGAGGPATVDTAGQAGPSVVQATSSIAGNATGLSSPSGGAHTAPSTTSVSGIGGTAGGVATSNPQPAVFTVPTSGLYTVHTKPGQKYLVETNPAFANQKQWLSSDYMLKDLGIDPAKTQKRLGDGFYEQQLVRNQVMSLTGRNVLGNYADEEAQFRAMMTAGAKVTKDLGIRPGISLTADQIARLTENVVLLETREVAGEKVLVPVVYLAQLGEGQLLTSGPLIAASDIALTDLKGFSNSGTLKADNTLSLGGQSIDNRGGNLQSGGLMTLATTGGIDLTSARVKAGSLNLDTGGDLLLNTGAKQIGMNVSVGTRTTTLMGRTASLDVAGDARIVTGRDFQQNGARLNVGGDLTADIGRDWILGTQQFNETAQGAAGGTQFSTSYTRNLTSAITVGGLSDLKTGNDLTARGAQIDLKGGGLIRTGGDLTLGAVKDSIGHDSTNHGSGHYGRNQSYDETVIGTSINSGNSLALTSGKDINLTASGINVAKGSATLVAKGNVNLKTETERHESLLEDSGGHGNFVHSSSSEMRTTQELEQAVGSSLSADKIDIVSGKNINVTGSSIAGTGDVSLDAAGDINIKAATSTYSQTYYNHTTESGLMSSGGIGFTIGSREQTDQSKANGTLQSQNRSMVGSIGGNLTLTAGENAKVSGSDLLAGNDLGVRAENITFDTGFDRNTATESHDFKQSGLTVAIGNPVVNAVQTVQQMSQAANQTSDPRMKALAAMTAGLAVNNAWDAVQTGQTVLDKDGNNIANAADKVGGINVSVSLGSTSSHSESAQTSDQRFGSSAVAGHNLTLVATGKDSATHAGETHPASGEAGEREGNITAIGATLRAGNDATLDAANAIDLQAAQSTASQTSSNSSNSSSIGVSFGLGKGGGGLNFNIAASQSRGNADGNDTGYTNTHVDAVNTLTLKSGGDTTLKGATATGKQVTADIGGDLNIESLQDTSTYDSQQNSAGFSLSFSPAGVPTGGSINGSQSNINSNYASVTEQSGLKAGDGGYTVNVDGDTTLKGAVIAASDQAISDGKTTFTSGGDVTLTDINNSASYQADAAGFSAGVGSQLGASGGTGSDSGDAQSTTTSGIGVSTGKDTTGALAKIFDANKVTADINAQVQITQAFSQVAPKAVGDYATGKLTEAANLRAQADKETDPAKRDALNRQADALNEAWKEGGSARVALHTAVGALSGGLEGALGAGTTAFTAPAIAEQINKLDVPKEVKQVLLMTAGAIVGGTAGGAAGATTSVAQVGNNYLKHVEIDALLKTLKECGNDQACKNKAITDATALSQKNDAALQSECAANPTSPACQGHIQDALNYAGDQQETSGIAETMGSDITRSRTVVLDQTLNGGSYSAVNGIEIRADFFGAMGQQTGAPWFKASEDVSRNDLQGPGILIGDALNNGQVSVWRDTAGNQIMKRGFDNFRSIYNNPTQNVNKWSVNQLVSEQNDPKLQTIHQQYFPNFNSVTQTAINWLGGVNDLLSPSERIKTGCVKMGMLENCGASQ